MGLGVSHDCFRGAYSAFMRLRQAIAAAAGLPPLQLMDGYYEEGAIVPRFLFSDEEKAGDFSKHPTLGKLPIKWDYFETDPLVTLLTHSDCEGEIAAADCEPLAARLEELLPKLGSDGGGHLEAVGGVRGATELFIAGLRRAAAAGEDVEFR